MPDEISVSVSLSVNKNDASYSRSRAFSADMTGNTWTTGVVEFAHNTATEIVTPTDLATYRWVLLHLTDSSSEAADYVDFSHHSAVDPDDVLCRLHGNGQSCIFKTAGITSLHGKATIAEGSGSVLVEYAIVEL